MIYVSSPTVNIVDYLPPIIGSPLVVVYVPKVYTTIYQNSPTVNIVDYLPSIHGTGGPPHVLHPAIYRLLEPHYIGTAWYDVGTIVTEGVEIPSFTWVPTLAVEPLNSQAVNYFYNAGPRDVASAVSWDLNVFDGKMNRLTTRTATFWKQVPGTGTFVLTGLGSSFPPRGP